MQEKKQEKLPLDAKLLSEAVIELNISRRSVGMYPTDHPIVKESIERAFNCLNKLFEIRSSITLGIAGDTLVVDEYKLDRKNAVFMEFANSFHSKGIAAITFSTGLSKEELTGVNELITAKNMPAGKDLAEMAKKQIAHITLSPLDFESFRFVEGGRKKPSAINDVWEEYIYGLLAGRLGTGNDPNILLQIPPEEVAGFVNAAMAGEQGNMEAYDRVIAAYLQKKEGPKLSSEAYNKFILFIEKLSPELKRQFLATSFTHTISNMDEVEKTISDMTAEDFNRVARVFAENSSIIPVTLKNFIDKLSSFKQNSGSFNFFPQRKAVIDDIELSEEVLKLFSEDHFKAYVSEDYQRMLNDMLMKASTQSGIKSRAVEDECRDEVIDRVMLEVMIELLEYDQLNDEDYLSLLTKLSESVNIFIGTGRFTEVLEVYNTLVSHSLHGRSSRNASSMREYFFHSEDFISKFIEALKLWGRKDREGAFRLARALKGVIIAPLLDMLLSEPEAGMRKFLLSVFKAIGSDVNPYAIKKLNDTRWYVVRNMLYLLRECEGRLYVSNIRKFAKHENTSICLEAVKTLLHFGTADAVPFLKLYLQSENEHLRSGAVKLSGLYKVKEAVPVLIKILLKKDALGLESGHKTEAVRALGDIGDRASVSALVSLYSSRTFFYKGYLKDLKTEIFKSLENYPADSIRELLALGLKSDIEEIREISESLTAQGSGSQEGKRRR